MASGDRYTTTLVGAPGQYYHPTTSLHGHAIHLPYYAILSPHCLNYSSIILVVTYAIRYTCSLSQHQGVWGIFSASSKASGQVYMALTIHINFHRCVCVILEHRSYCIGDTTGSGQGVFACHKSCVIS